MGGYTSHGKGPGGISKNKWCCDLRGSFHGGVWIESGVHTGGAARAEAGFELMEMCGRAVYYNVITYVPL